jgi:hypothetical protein
VEAVIVLLDTGPLGRISNPRATPENEECRRWLANLLSQGVRVLVPEISDYAVRRELLRAGKARGIAHMDRSHITLGYLAITTPAMRQAAEFWAQARHQGQPTAPDLALDGDVILAAQATVLALQENDSTVVATENLRHLARFAVADYWRNIQPPTP